MRVLIIFSTFNNSRPMGDPSVWYRCYNFAEKLHERGICCDLAPESKMLDLCEFVKYYTHVIFFRPRKSLALTTIIAKCREEGVKLFASYDDLIFDPSTYRISSTLKSMARKSLIHSRYADWADAMDNFSNFILSSNFLATKVKAIKPDASIFIVENQLPNEIVNTLIDKPLTQNERPVLGYFGGGISHKEDIILIQRDLEKFCTEYNATLILPDSLQRFISPALSQYVSVFERLTYVDMLKLCCSVDICVAPLILDDNSRAKSSIKFSEAIVCGSALVATELEAYSPYKNSNNLYLSDNYSWYEKLSGALNDGFDNADRHEIVQSIENNFNLALDKVMGY